MKYLIRSGRVSAVRGLIARLLNIIPIVSLDEDGKAIIFDKTFSQKANMEKVIKHIKSGIPGKKIWNYIVLHANNQNAAAWFAEKIENLTGKKPVSVCNISPVIGGHAGVGAAAVAILYE